MIEKQETLADIVAEIGEKSDFCHNNISTKTWEDWERMHEWLLNLRSRIEGFALRRAIELSKQFVPGNAAAMREALSDMCYAALDVFRYFCGSQSEVMKELVKAFDKGKAVLSAPPRNCDVGTAEEQTERFLAFCNSNTCQLCCCKPNSKTDCAFIWAKMPYEKNDVK